MKICNQFKSAAAAVAAAMVFGACASTGGQTPVHTKAPVAVQAPASKPAAGPPGTIDGPAVVAPVASPGQPAAEGGPAPAAAEAALPEQKLAELFSAGVSAYGAGQLEEAERNFEAVLEEAPDVNAEFNLGLISERRGDGLKAEHHYQAALKRSPAHGPSATNLARLYRAQGKVDRAVAVLERALETKGQERDAQLLVALAHALRQAKQLDKAEAAAKKAFSRSRDDANAYKALALIYLDQGNLRLAEHVALAARRLDPKDPGVANTLGLIALRRDQRSVAMGYFQQAIATDPAYAPAQANLGALALAARDYVTAERAFGQVLGAEPQSYEARLRYAYALDGQKVADPKKGLAAGDEFERLLAQRPDAPEAICGAALGFAADRAGWDKAVGYLEKCVALEASAENRSALIAKLKTINAMRAADAKRAEEAAQAKKAEEEAAPPTPPAPEQGSLNAAPAEEPGSERAETGPGAEGAPPTGEPADVAGGTQDAASAEGEAPVVESAAANEAPGPGGEQGEQSAEPGAPAEAGRHPEEAAPSAAAPERPQNTPENSSGSAPAGGEAAAAVGPAALR